MPLIIDNFAGGGGASVGIEMALGRSPDYAINHDPVALAIHEANHPETRHLVQDVWQVDPVALCDGRPVDLAWFSPDCRHHSKAKGGKPISPQVRDLAWVAVRWAQQVKPRLICLENVEEFQDWGPVVDGKADPEQKGLTFRRFVRDLKAAGYAVEWRELRACDYGAPTIRKRLFLVARSDGQPIVWPTPTHGPDLIPYRTAAEIIDWSLPCPSIFDTSEQIMEKYGLRAVRPLADATMRRIAAGVKKYVLDAAEPFIVSIANYGSFSAGRSVSEPLSTATANPKGGHHALVSPTLIQTGYSERPGQKPRVPGLDKPLGTAVAGGVKHALVAAFLTAFGQNAKGSSPLEPAQTVLAGATRYGLAAAFLAQHNTGVIGRDLRDPVSTVTTTGSHQNLVAAFLSTYYGNGSICGVDEPTHTVTTKDRLQLVTVEIDGETYVISDIGMRMLTPRELARAQGFPDDYEFDISVDGKPIGKTRQVRAIGNSVCPDVVAAIVRANAGDVAEAEPSQPQRILAI